MKIFYSYFFQNLVKSTSNYGVNTFDNNNSSNNPYVNFIKKNKNQLMNSYNYPKLSSAINDNTESGKAYRALIGLSSGTGTNPNYLPTSGVNNCKLYDYIQDNIYSDKCGYNNYLQAYLKCSNILNKKQNCLENILMNDTNCISNYPVFSSFFKILQNYPRIFDSCKPIQNTLDNSQLSIESLFGKGNNDFKVLNSAFNSPNLTLLEKKDCLDDKKCDNKKCDDKESDSCKDLKISLVKPENTVYITKYEEPVSVDKATKTVVIREPSKEVISKEVIESTQTTPVEVIKTVTVAAQPTPSLENNNLVQIELQKLELMRNQNLHNPCINDNYCNNGNSNGNSNGSNGNSGNSNGNNVGVIGHIIIPEKSTRRKLKHKKRVIMNDSSSSESDDKEEEEEFIEKKVHKKRTIINTVTVSKTPETPKSIFSSASPMPIPVSIKTVTHTDVISVVPPVKTVSINNTSLISSINRENKKNQNESNDLLISIKVLLEKLLKEKEESNKGKEKENSNKDKEKENSNKDKEESNKEKNEKVKVFKKKNDACKEDYNECDENENICDEKLINKSPNNIKGNSTDRSNLFGDLSQESLLNMKSNMFGSGILDYFNGNSGDKNKKYCLENKNDIKCVKKVNNKSKTPKLNKNMNDKGNRIKNVNGDGDRDTNEKQTDDFINKVIFEDQLEDQEPEKNIKRNKKLFKNFSANEYKSPEDHLLNELLIFINKDKRTEEDVLNILQLIRIVKNKPDGVNSYVKYIPSSPVKNNKIEKTSAINNSGAKLTDIIKDKTIYEDKVLSNDKKKKVYKIIEKNKGTTISKDDGEYIDKLVKSYEDKEEDTKEDTEDDNKMVENYKLLAKNQINSKDNDKVISEDDNKVNPKDASKVNSKNVTKVNSEDVIKVNPKDASKVNSKNVTKVNPKDVIKVNPKDISKEDTKVNSQEDGIIEKIKQLLHLDTKKYSYEDIQRLNNEIYSKNEEILSLKEREKEIKIDELKRRIKQSNKEYIKESVHDKKDKELLIADSVDSENILEDDTIEKIKNERRSKKKVPQKVKKSKNNKKNKKVYNYENDYGESESNYYNLKKNKRVYNDENGSDYYNLKKNKRVYNDESGSDYYNQESEDSFENEKLNTKVKKLNSKKNLNLNSNVSVKKKNIELESLKEKQQEIKIKELERELKRVKEVKSFGDVNDDLNGEIDDNRLKFNNIQNQKSKNVNTKRNSFDLNKNKKIILENGKKFNIFNSKIDQKNKKSEKSEKIENNNEENQKKTPKKTIVKTIYKKRSEVKKEEDLKNQNIKKNYEVENVNTEEFCNGNNCSVKFSTNNAEIKFKDESKENDILINVPMGEIKKAIDNQKAKKD